MLELNFNELEDDERKVEALANHITGILNLLGEDVNREGLLRTPERVARVLQFLTSGSNQENNIDQLLKSGMFEHEYDEMVLVKDIEFYSLCEHHLMPFYGRVHVAYLPQGKVIGLSKIPRLVDVYARRLQVQERMTTEIRNALQTYLEPKGVAVMVQAHHMCMMVRGVQKQQSTTTTVALSGDFLHDIKTREEFMHLVFSNNHGN
jgi:GTP cyclohydrolase I